MQMDLHQVGFSLSRLYKFVLDAELKGNAIREPKSNTPNRIPLDRGIDTALSWPNNFLLYSHNIEMSHKNQVEEKEKKDSPLLSTLYLA